MAARRSFDPATVGRADTSNRWALLGLLALVGITIGLSFESVPVLVPYMRRDIAMSFGETGLLIGISSGVAAVFSIPGSIFAARAGDRMTVLTALVCIAVGSFALTFAHAYSHAIAGRVLCGVGTMLLGMTLSKMVVDVFLGRELATAMAINIAMWPLGLTLALVVLSRVAVATTWRTTMAIGGGFVLAVAIVFALLFRRPAAAAIARPRLAVSRREAVLVTLAGISWGLLNSGLICYLGFAQGVLVEHGMPLAAAQSTVGLATVAMLVSLPVAGIVSDKLRKPRLILVVGSTLNGVAYFMVARGGSPSFWVVAIGLSVGFFGPTVASLPGLVLRADTRAAGYGIWNMVASALQALTPSVAGSFLDHGASRGAPLLLGAVSVLLVIPTTGAMFYLKRRWIPLTG